MLFNSLPFIFGFLPVVLAVFFLIGRVGAQRLALAWLTAASLFFYGWWNPRLVGLLVASAAFNYAMAALIGRRHGTAAGRRLTAAAIAGDLVLLGYFKYTNFFIGVIDAAAHLDWPFFNIVLPLGISFFTFTQIAFVVDTWHGEAEEYGAIRYLLFVSYFPHLIAGPIIHHREVMPQFGAAPTYRFNTANFVEGLLLFTLGLASKVLVADNFGWLADPIFRAAHGLDPTTAWIGALAYTLQIYFDFAGYSQMAIGLSKMFNVDLPINFNAPYTAASIIDFWRRWHMTLSRFLRDYLYFPLGGNRRGAARRHLNLMVTMLLGGLWHGANWTFVVWGGLHGAYLVVNHGWRAARRRFGWERPSRLGRLAATALSFVAVVIAWVLFRSDNLGAAGGMLAAMAGLGPADAGFVLPVHLSSAAELIAAGLVLTFVPALVRASRFAPLFRRDGGSVGLVAGAVAGVLFTLAVARITQSPSVFLYYQF